MAKRGREQTSSAFIIFISIIRPSRDEEVVETLLVSWETLNTGNRVITATAEEETDDTSP